MKKYLLFFLTSFASIWLISKLFNGIKGLEKPEVTLFVALLLAAGIFLTDKVVDQMKKKNIFITVLIGSLVNFFVLYLGTLIFNGFSITGGALRALQVGIVSTPSSKNVDQILTLLLAALISMLIAQLTVWSMKGSAGKSE